LLSTAAVTVAAVVDFMVAAVEDSTEAAAVDSVVAARRDLSVAADFLEGAEAARGPSAASALPVVV
jgi:hypothetical protein